MRMSALNQGYPLSAGAMGSLQVVVHPKGETQLAVQGMYFSPYMK
jgi:hypothetical protein